jgi:hypothetical protein
MAKGFGADILIQAQDPGTAASFYVRNLGFEITDNNPNMIGRFRATISSRFSSSNGRKCSATKRGSGLRRSNSGRYIMWNLGNLQVFPAGASSRHRHHGEIWPHLRSSRVF